MNTRLLLLRHGQIKANKVGRWHGSTDSPLTWKGRRQAKRTGQHLLAQKPLTVVYASTVQRCQDTARFASQEQNLKIQTLDGLQEMGIGEWEDTPFRELVDRHDFVNRATRDLDYAAPGGESLSQVAARVKAAFEQIDSQHDAGETILVVSHGVALAVALAVYLHESPAHWVKYHFNNCSLTELELTPEPVVHSFNQSAHL